MKDNSLNLTLKISGLPVEISLSVPNKQTKQDVLLALFRKVSQKVEKIAIDNLTLQGLSVSCQKGCSACCYQLIPLSVAEARYVNTLVEKMPKNRKKKIQERFAHVLEEVQQAGLTEDLMNTAEINDSVTELGLKYFAIRVACPFLEDNSCSIYEERPLRCREYLVTSASANCKRPTKDTVALVDFPLRMSSVFSTLNRPWTRYNRDWVPLSLIPAWLKAHSESAPLRHSKEWIEDALKMLSNP